MFFSNRQYGKLVKKENLNGVIIYTVENSKGKMQSLSFGTDVCPTANIGDEVFFIYKRNAFSDTKKGFLLSSHLKEATIFNNKFLYPGNLLFWKEFVAFTAAAIISMTASVSLFSYGIIFLLHGLDIQHVGDFGLWGVKLGLLLSVCIPGAFLFTRFFRNLEKFVKLSQRRDRYFLPYKKANFSRKDILLNKTLDAEEKTKLTMFVRGIDSLSSTEKLEIYEYIDEKKKMNVSDIGYLDILNVSNKLKTKKQVEQLLLK